MTTKVLLLLPAFILFATVYYLYRAVKIERALMEGRITLEDLKRLTRKFWTWPI